MNDKRERLKECYKCQNKKAIKENGRHVLICKETGHIIATQMKVICGHFKSTE